MILRKIIERVFDRFGKGVIAIKFPDGSVHGVWDSAEVQIEFLTRKAMYRALALGYVGFMEAYFEGAINIGGNFPDPLSRLINLTYEKTTPERNPILNGMQWIQELTQDNSSLHRARKNAEAHYDLPAEFFRLFLGNTYGYTEGYFRRGDESQDEAQHAKFDLICKKLKLKPGMKVNEVGSGWGYGAVHAAKHYGVDVVNYGLVEEQNRVMREMIHANNLSDKVKVVKKDYRELEDEKEVYDRHFSIGVMEHAGFRCHESWIRAIASALKPGGIGVISTMGRGKRQFTDYLITKHIFPGGYIPSLPEINKLLLKYDLHVVHKEDLRWHYGKSCELWLADFRKNWDKIALIDSARFTERFRRMWEMYLAGSAAAFHHPKQNLSVYHLVFTKGRLPDDLRISDGLCAV
jgi:cyclopropane-fatty-acyl-phospholipid synthase